MEVSQGCNIVGVVMQHDTHYRLKGDILDHATGMFDFTLTCAQPVVTVSIHFYGLENADKYIVRKYTTYNDTFQNLDGESVVDKTIGGQPVVKVTYTLTDGGKYDNDQTVNGTFKEPVGLATAPNELPATGVNSTLIGFFKIMFLDLGAVVALISRSKLVIFK